MPCKAYIPKAAKHVWAQCLLSAVAAVLQHNDELAWLDLLMLPKAVLRASARSGKQHRTRIDAETKRLCKDWLDGHRTQLWRQSKSLATRRRTTRPRSPNEAQSQRSERAIRLIKEELLSKACGALVDGQAAAVTPAIRREMSEKHPRTRGADEQRMAGLRQVHAAATQAVDMDAVRKAVRGFARGSAAGPTGLRPQHLKDALIAGLEDEIVRHLAQITTLLARGRAPSSIAPWLCGAKLAALEKPQGGHRPVAVGETWRRLTAKVLADNVGEELRAHLEPLQLGVGSQLACEAIVHVVRQWLARHAADRSRCLVKMDLSNAFNCVDRSAVLASVRRVVPELAPWADYCYKVPSRLILGGGVLLSERGVQQGDPLGPAFFALAIHEAVRRSRAAVDRAHRQELDISVFYLDDGVVAGSGRAVSMFCNELRRELADIGLELAFSKCEVVPAAKDQHEIPAGLFSGFTWVLSGDFQLLGTPLGSEQFCTALTNKRSASATVLLRSIERLGNSQGSYLLMKQCAGFAKLAYSIRTVPPALHRSALQSFSASLRGALTSVVGEIVMEDRCWELAQLNVQSGGIGLRAPDRHATAAYWASLVSSRELCCAVDPGFDITDACGGLQLQATLEEFNGRILEAARGTLQEGQASQRRLSALIDAASKTQLLQSTQADASFRAHVSLCSLPTAGAWLTAPPADDAREMDHRLFQISLRRRLRMRIFEADCFCLSCGACMDAFADHALVCQCSGDRTVRHNCLRNLVYEEAGLAGLRPEREKAGLLPQRPGSDGLSTSTDERRRRPADVWLPSGPTNRSEAVDFACTSGLRTDMVSRVDLQAPIVFSEYEHVKRSFKNTAQVCEAQGFVFSPIVIEAHSGAWSPAARKLFDFITEKAAAASSTYTKAEHESLRFAQRLSVTLHRENARAIARRMAEVPPMVRDDGWDQWAE